MAGLEAWTEEKSAGLRPDRELVVPLGLLAVFALTICAYATSLAGGWVWDDPFLLGDASVFRNPLQIITQDAWSATGHQPATIYRPLSLLSHAATQVLWPGPLSARLFSLALHLLNVFLVARLVVALRPADATRRQWGEPALFGAAVFALHPLTTQTVAQIGRTSCILAMSDNGIPLS
jgi:hypothetical protein